MADSQNEDDNDEEQNAIHIYISDFPKVVFQADENCATDDLVRKGKSFYRP